MSHLKEPLHPEGPKLSRIVAGMWRLDEWSYTQKELIGWIEKCMDFGVTSFDHADIYGDYRCESLFGAVLKEKPGLRGQIELVSKCGICLISNKKPFHKITHYNTTADHIISSVQQSLENLNTDYLDLLLIHRPSPLMDADETAAGLNRLIRSEIVRNVGVSNFTPSQFNLLQSRLDRPLVTNQVEFSLLHADPVYDGTFDQMQTHRIRPIVWSPFGGGRLFSSDETRAVRVRKVLNKLAVKYQADIDQIALAWLLTFPSRPFPVLGTGKIERIEKAVGALEIDLERQDWFALLEAYHGEPVP